MRGFAKGPGPPEGKCRLPCSVLLLWLLVFPPFPCQAAASDPPPVITTMPATFIHTDRVKLNGFIGPSKSRAEIWFEYGTGPDPSTWTSSSSLPTGPISEELEFRASIEGLAAYATFYFRAAARNSSGVSRGGIRSFSTGEYYVALGDSITRAGNTGGFASILRGLLEKSRGCPIVVANYGVSEATSAAALQFLAHVVAGEPSSKYFLIQFGTNDAMLLVPVPSGLGMVPGDPGYDGSFKGNMQKIVSTLEKAGKVPFLAKIPFSEVPWIHQESLRQYNAVIEELVTANGIRVRPPDFFGYFREHPDQLSDGVHPNNSGYEAMAELWLRALTAPPAPPDSGTPGR